MKRIISKIDEPFMTNRMETLRRARQMGLREPKTLPPVIFTVNPLPNPPPNAHSRSSIRSNEKLRY